MKNITVTEVPHSDGTTIPRFSISYGTAKSETEQRARSLSIIRALAGSSDCVIDVYSELLTAPPSQREDVTIAFRNTLKKGRIAHEYMEFLTESTGSFLSKMLMFGRSNKIIAHRVITQFDVKSWSRKDIAESLPYYGIKIYVLRKKTDAPKLIKALLKPETRDDDFTKYVRMIAFECMQYGMVGVFHSDTSVAELKALLSSFSD